MTVSTHKVALQASHLQLCERVPREHDNPRQLEAFLPALWNMVKLHNMGGVALSAVAAGRRLFLGKPEELSGNLRAAPDLPVPAPAGSARPPVQVRYPESPHSPAVAGSVNQALPIPGPAPGTHHGKPAESRPGSRDLPVPGAKINRGAPPVPATAFRPVTVKVVDGQHVGDPALTPEQRPAQVPAATFAHIAASQDDGLPVDGADHGIRVSAGGAHCCLPSLARRTGTGREEAAGNKTTSKGYVLLRLHADKE